MKIHMVKKGDTLYQIAQKYNVDLDALIALNSQIADPNVIDVGMKVKIPTTPKPAEPPTDYLYKHIVMQGDTLWKLGKAWNVPLNDMIEANPQLKNPSVLMTGETVYIPKAHSGQNHGSPHHYQGGHGHKKNTAPIAPAPVAPMPMPMPIENYPQVNVPNKSAPAAEMPYMPFPNIPNIPNIPNVPNMPNVEMPYHPSPVSELPFQAGPNMEQPFNVGPNVEMPYQTSPVSELPFQAGPNMEQPFNVGPNVEYPYNQSPNFPAPYSPLPEELSAAENNPNQPMYVSPFSEQIPDLMPEVPSNIPMQEPSSHLFQQFQVPATEVMSQPYQAPHMGWQPPEAPSFAGMPSAEQLPFGGFPGQGYPQAQMFPAPNYTAPMFDQDCGCGGPHFGGYPQPAPYFGPQSQFSDFGQQGPMMHPGLGYPGMGMPELDQPYPSYGYDPMAMTQGYPGAFHPAQTFPGMSPYGGNPFGGYDFDKSRGEELSNQDASNGLSSARNAAKPASAASSKKKKRPVQTAVTRSTKTGSRISKPKKRSPWMNL